MVGSSFGHHTETFAEETSNTDSVSGNSAGNPPPSPPCSSAGTISAHGAPEDMPSRNEPASKELEHEELEHEELELEELEHAQLGHEQLEHGQLEHKRPEIEEQSLTPRIKSLSSHSNGEQALQASTSAQNGSGRSQARAQSVVHQDAARQKSASTPAVAMHDSDTLEAFRNSVTDKVENKLQYLPDHLEVLGAWRAEARVLFLRFESAAADSIREFTCKKHEYDTKLREYEEARSQADAFASYGTSLLRAGASTGASLSAFVAGIAPAAPNGGEAAEEPQNAFPEKSISDLVQKELESAEKLRLEVLMLERQKTEKRAKINALPERTTCCRTLIQDLDAEIGRTEIELWKTKAAWEMSSLP